MPADHPPDRPGAPQSSPETAAPAVPAPPGDAIPTESSPDRNAAPPPDSAGRGPRPYDFRHPVFLSASDLRRLRLRQEEFSRALAARLSIYLRLEFALQLTALEMIPYRRFCDGLPQPTHLSLFKIEPLRGLGLLEIPPRLGLTIVDRLLGGPAQAVAADRELSEIELALLAQAVQIIVSEWCHHWADLHDLQPTLLGHETNGHFLQTAPHDTLLLVLALEARLGDCVEKMQIALPCTTLEPLIRKLALCAEPPAHSPPIPATLPAWNKRFDDVPVPVTAIWEDLEFTARQVASLKVGDVLPLDPASVRQVRLRVATLPKFQGRLGTTNGKWAVALTEVLRLSP